MLSLHAVKCIIEWRKQLVYSYLVTTSNGAAAAVSQERNSINKFKNIPFIWEGENYLLKMKADTGFLFHSEFSKFFNFSAKSDPFLVQPSLKHPGTSISGQVAVGGGAHALKSLRRNPQ